MMKKQKDTQLIHLECDHLTEGTGLSFFDTCIADVCYTLYKNGEKRFRVFSVIQELCDPKEGTLELATTVANSIRKCSQTYIQTDEHGKCPLLPINTDGLSAYNLSSFTFEFIDEPYVILEDEQKDRMVSVPSNILLI